MRIRRSCLVFATSVCLVLAGGVAGVTSAGNLEPSAPPNSTMKTLDEIPPAWSQIVAGTARFELVMGGEAVLDKETGLVWEQAPDNTTVMDWNSACIHCYQREVANRKGWRLPTVEELASLVNNDNSTPSLPTGHPFTSVRSDYYWSSTTSAGNSVYAWRVGFVLGGVNINPKTEARYAWCVRGSHGHDAY